jgi:predicted HAD superfamily Cof-like phosphohydrolase
MRYEDPGVRMVAEFHDLMGPGHAHEDPTLPTLSGIDVRELRRAAKMISDMASLLKVMATLAREGGREGLGLLLTRLQLQTEETGELGDAMADQDILKILAELTDCSYSVDGTYLTFGLGHYKPAADAEIHSANMRKVWEDGRMRLSEAGRVMKPPGWTPPDIRRAILGLAAVNGERAAGAEALVERWE